MNEQQIHDKKIEAQDMMKNAGREARERIGETKEEATTYAKEKAHALRDRATGYADEATNYIKHHPMAAVTAAVLVGMLAGLMVKRSL